MRSVFTALAAFGAIAHLACLGVAGAQGPLIQLEKPWVRRALAAPDQQGRTAAYLIIQNRGAVPDTLLSATADAAERVERHETRSMSGMMMMESVSKIAVAPGARVELKPGGYHLMLIGLRRSLGPGETIALTLTFERAGPVRAQAEVR
jgi:copper(I)-binding protein